MSKKNAKVNNKRWAAYAAAGVAATLAGTQSAEADITYVVSGATTGGDLALPNTQYFALEPGASLVFYNFGGANQGLVGVFDSLGAPTPNGVAAFSAGGFDYASNLASGANVSTAPGFPNSLGFATLAGGTVGFTSSQFLGVGGFVGFQFDVGGGAQFGWASLTYVGEGVGNGFQNLFILEDYAYGMVGDTIAAGEGRPGAIPEPTSLGLLALGAVGVLVNRRRKQVA